jgi:hypothetical protein
VYVEQTPNWYTMGLCLNKPEIVENAEQGRQIQRAKKLCNACPVKRDCLYEAIKLNSFGWFGGTTYEERNMMSSLMSATKLSWDGLLSNTSQPVQLVTRTDFQLHI